jgi:D-amino-acid dehydrogenase
MLGVTLAPATGEAIADLITTGDAPEVITPFDPGRFARG